MSMKRRMYVDLDEETVKQILELNTHKGEMVMFTLWSNQPPVKGIFSRADWSDVKNQIIVGIDHCDDGCNHWAYADEIEFIR